MKSGKVKQDDIVICYRCHLFPKKYAQTRLNKISTIKT